MRFTSSQTERYREHLDWHFRQNQREKDGARIMLHRKWFYSLDVSKFLEKLRIDIYTCIYKSFILSFLVIPALLILYNCNLGMD